MPTKREKKFRKTSEKMEGFSLVTPITGLNRHNTGKADDFFLILDWALHFGIFSFLTKF
jgi:hypothetical protein